VIDPTYAAELRRYIRHLQAELKVAKGQTSAPPAPDLISDHATFRYMERVKGIDMRRLKSEILPHERRHFLATGAGRIKANGYELICDKGIVVTISAAAPPVPWRDRPRGGPRA
jgi:hypothetical protein